MTDHGSHMTPGQELKWLRNERERLREENRCLVELLRAVLKESVRYIPNALTRQIRAAIEGK